MTQHHWSIPSRGRQRQPGTGVSEVNTLRVFAQPILSIAKVAGTDTIRRISGGSVERVIPIKQLEWSKCGFRPATWAGSTFALLWDRGSWQDFKRIALILLNNGGLNSSVGERVTAIWTGNNPPGHDGGLYDPAKLPGNTPKALVSLSI